MNSVHFMSKKSDWETPQDLFNKLHDEFHFTLDAAASEHNHKLPRYYTESENGLAQDWGGNGSFVIFLMGAKKRVCGQKNVGKRLKSRIRLSFFSFQPEQTVNLFTILFITNLM